MPKVVKYSTTTPSGSLRKGNMAIGPGNYDYGTSFYSAIEPPAGGYTIYLNKGSNGPSIYCPANDTQLINITKEISGTTYASAAQCLNYFATQTDKVVIASSDEINPIVTNGLVLNLNADMVSSYPAINTAWYDVSGGGNNGTLTNGPTFDSNGFITFDGIDDQCPFYAPGLGGTATVEMWTKCISLSGKMFFGWAGYDVWTQGDTVGYNTGNSDIYGMSSALVSSLGIVGNWKHLVFEMRSDVSYTNNKIYVNGINQSLAQQYSSENSGNRNFNGGSGTICGWLYGGYYMNQQVSSFRVYNRALTQAEILQNYYQAPIVTNNLSYIWDAGNLVSYPKSGTTTYNMTGSINGTLQNGVTYNSGYGGYWSFDGADDRILLDNANYSFLLGDGNSNWTVNAWIRTTTGANGLGQGSVLSNSNGGPVYSEMGVNGGKIVYWVYPSNINNWKGWTGNITVNNGTWHMLTWVNKVGYTMDMYVDGVLDVTISPTNAGNNNPIDIIGGSWAGVFQGDIATVQVYQGKAFNGNEVNQNFSAQRGRFGL